MDTTPTPNPHEPPAGPPCFRCRTPLTPATRAWEERVSGPDGAALEAFVCADRRACNRRCGQLALTRHLWAVHRN